MATPDKVGGQAEVVFREDRAVVKRVSVASTPDAHYAPEVHLCTFLDRHYPDAAPHTVYTHYARAHTVHTLTRFYQQLVAEHQIDAVVLVDGGSDALMVGDEEGLGDPIEDAVSVATVAALDGVRLKVLVNISVGTDRFNHVSDAASLRAIAELTAAGGFLGAVSLEPTTPAVTFYRSLIETIYAHQTFRSVQVGVILAALAGRFALTDMPMEGAGRGRDVAIYVWPLMAVLWAFDVVKVAERSLVVEWIRTARTYHDCYLAIHHGRLALGEGLRGVENLPRHEDLRNPVDRFF